MERIIDVYYGRDNLPYKDEQCTIHFPVAGSEFLGASQTTTIRFHYEQIGTDENVYTVESKRPDGKTGSDLLSKNTTEHYAEISLSGWYSECKGDLFLSLKVYKGGTTATYNEEARLWEVSGVPVIESTGAIKLAINYTPMGRYENYNDAVETFQQVLAALGNKLEIEKGIVVSENVANEIASSYEEGQVFFNEADKGFYKLESGVISPYLLVYSKSETDTLLGGKVDKLTTTGKYLYSHDGSTQEEIRYSASNIGGTIVQRQSNGQIVVNETPTDNGYATSKKYVDDNLSLKADKSTTYTKTEVDNALDLKADKSDTYTKTQVDNAISSAVSSAYKYKGSVATYNDLPSSGNEVGDVYNVEDTGDNYAWTGSAWDKLSGTVDLSSYYTKTETDALLSSKQATLVSGTNIKTINGQSLLDSGNIEISYTPDFATNSEIDALFE